jgi:hypothetical protein
LRSRFKAVVLPALGVLVLFSLLSPGPLFAQDWGEWEDPPSKEKPKPKPKAPPGDEPERPRTPREPREPRETDEPEAEKQPAEVFFSEAEGLGFSSEKMRLTVHALLQSELRVFEVGDLFASNAFRFRRAYVGLDGIVDKWLEWKCVYDLADPAGSNAGALRDIYGRVTFTENLPVHIGITAGYFKPAVGGEHFRMEPEFLTFLERAAHVSGTHPGRCAGVMVDASLPGEKGSPPKVRGWLGLHNGRAGPLGNVNNDWGISLMGEATPLDDKFTKMRLQFGLGNWVGYSGIGGTTGWRGVSPDGNVNFFNPIGAYTLRGFEQVHSLHGRFFYDRFALMAEFTYGLQYRTRDGANDLSPLVSRGIHVDACLMLWSPDGKPVRDPELNRGVEACLRVERYELDEINRGSAHRSQPVIFADAPNILGGRMGAVTLGANWYVNRRLRVCFNLQAQYFHLEARTKFFTVRTDHKIRTGGPRVFVGLRLQVFI